MANTIYATFDDRQLAEKAVGALMDRGVNSEDISMVSHENAVDQSRSQDPRSYVRDVPPVSTGSTASEYNQESNTAPTNLWAGHSPEYTETYPNPVSQEITGQTVPPVYGEPPQRPYDLNALDAVFDAELDEETSAKSGISTTTAADAGEGAMKGAAWGVGLGILAGISSLFIPGIGLVVGGGALALAIGGAAATTAAGAAAGAVTGYLVDQGVDSHVAENFTRKLAEGGAILAVAIPSGQVGEEEVQEVMRKYGAVNVMAYAPRGYMA